MTNDISSRKEPGDYDWVTIEQTFVSGKMKLKHLSFEHTGNPADPAYITLQGRSKKGNWREKREHPQAAFATNAASDMAPTAPYQGGVTEDEFDDAVDAVKQSVRMLKMSRQLVELFEAVQPGLKKTMEGLDIDKISDTNPIAFVGFLNAMSKLIEVSGKLERDAMGALNIDTAIQVCRAFGYDVIDKRQQEGSNVVPLKSAIGA